MPIHPDEQTLTLIEKRHEYDDVYSFFFKPERRVDFKAGMYAHVRIPNGEEGHKTREFSIASAPSEENVLFSAHIWEGSPYKRKLGALEVGDTIEIFKLRGIAVLPEDKGTEVVLIAGGIGIAPMRSVLLESEYIGREPKPILIHVGRDNYLYEDELSKLPCEQKRITREEVDEVLKDTTSAHRSARYYISGPPKFVTEISEKLQKLNVLEGNILKDEFTGYEEVAV